MSKKKAKGEESAEKILLKEFLNSEDDCNDFIKALISHLIYQDYTPDEIGRKTAYIYSLLDEMTEEK